MASITLEARDSLVALYIGMFNAAPGSANLSTMVQAYESGKTLKQIAADFDNSDFRSQYPAFLTADEFAARLVSKLLGSEVDQGPKDWATNWIKNKLLSGTSDTDVIVEAVNALRATTNTNYDNAKAAVDNKVTVANYYSITKEQSSTDLATLQSVVSSVTSDSTTVTTAQTSVDNTIAGALAKTLTLTTGADTTLVGAEGDDTFVGAIGSAGTIANGTTLTAGDSLDGKAGTDTLSVAVSGSAGSALTVSAMTLSNIEKIDVSNFDVDTTQANTHTFDLSQTTGVTDIILSGSSANGDTLFSNIAAIANATMKNGSADLTLTYVSGATLGSTTTQNLTLSAQTAGTFTANGVEILNITSSGSANTLTTLAGDALATINVSGDKNLTLTDATTNTIKTVDASALTGNLTLTTDDTTDMALTGGAGNDTFKLGSTFTSADTVDGGAGTDNLETSVAVTNTTLGKVSNVETLTVTGGANVTLNADTSITTVDVDDAGASVVTLNAGLTTAMTVKAGVGDKVDNSSAKVALTVEALSSSLQSADNTTITGGTGTDELKVTGNSTAADAQVDFASRITAVDKVTVVDAGDNTSGSLFLAGADVNLQLGAYTTALTIDGSALDGGTLSGVTLVNDETLTVGGSTATKSLTITGGGGRDTITGGTVDDTIDGGAGNDSLNGSAGGNDYIMGGAGNDTINMGGAMTANDTIDGGEGTDTLSVTSLSGAALANVTNIETLSLSGASSSATLTSNLSFTTIDMATVDDAAQTLTLSTGYTAATTVKVDAGDKVVNSANVVLDVTATAADLQSADATTITGGTGSDTLTVTADNTTANVVATSGLITNVDKIVVVDGGDVTTGTTTAGKDITIDLASYATALEIDASALDAGTLNGSTLEFDEVLTITGTATGKLTITGGGGADTFIGSSSATGDSINGGAGNDTFTMAGNLANTDTLDGGDGTDTVTVTGALTDVAMLNTSNMETLTLGTTATLASSFDSAGFTKVNVQGANAVDASGTQKGHTFANASAGNVDIKGGLGDDTFTFTAGVTPDANDKIDGGAGTDTVTLANTATITPEIDFDNMTKIETVKLGSGNGAAADGTTETVTLTVSAISATTAQTINLDGSGITDSDDKLTITNNAASSTTKFNITGGAAGDSLAGSDGADTIDGGAGADTLSGGKGADQLTGGAGNDSFSYAVDGDFTVVPSGNLAADTITDFASGSDVISVALDLAGGNSTSVYNAKYVGTAASNGDALSLLSSKAGEYFFNTTTKQLIMDVNGDGLIQANDLYVGLTGLSELKSGNVVVTVSNLDTTTTSLNVTGGDGNDTYTLLTADFTSADTIDGGAGTDTISISDASATAAIDADFTNVKNMENLTLTGASTAVLGTLANAAGIVKVTTGNAATTVTANALGTLTVDGALMADDTTLTLDGTGATNYTVTATLGANVTSSNGTGTLNITYGNIADNEATVTAGTTGNVTVTGGDAGDTITVTGLATANQVFSGTTAKFVVTGGANAQSITTAGEADTITGAAGADTISSGAGNDQLTYLLTADLFSSNAAVDSVDGGAGTDVLSVGTNGTAFTIANTDVWTRISNVESIKAVANSAAVSISLDVTAQTQGITTVDLSAANTSTAHKIDVSEYTSTGTTLIAAATVTTVIGGAGADTITSGAGNDVLTLGNGADVIKFAGSTAASNGADTVSDFKVAQTDVLNFATVLSSGAIANATSGTAITLASQAALATEGTGIAVATNRVYVAQVANKADVDATGDIATALADTGVMDAVDVATSAEVILVVSGADDTNTFYVYGINNDTTAAVAGSEIALLATVTTDTTTLITSNFAFS